MPDNSGGHKQDPVPPRILNVGAREAADRRNRAGRSARNIADAIYLKRAVVAIGGGIGLLVRCLKLLPAMPRAGIWGLLVLLVAIRVIARQIESTAKACRKEERKAERGARAEELVGEALEHLAGQYAVFHNVDTGHGDIDHVVLTRNHGVFVLETKSHFGEVAVRNGELLIDGQATEKDFIAQALRNTMWLTQVRQSRVKWRKVGQGKRRKCLLRCCRITERPV